MLSADEDEAGIPLKPPTEKERRSMVIVVSSVGLVITLLAATMVGITLGLSHMFEESEPFPDQNISGKHIRNLLSLRNAYHRINEVRQIVC